MENILSLQECRFLVALYDQYSELASSRDYNCRPLLDYYTLRDVDNKSATWVYGVTLRCKAKIEVDLRYPATFCRIILRRVYIVGGFTYTARGQ